MSRHAILALLALPLAGCRVETMQAGDLRVSQTAFLSTNTLHAACAQFNAGGTPLSSTTIDNSGTGDVAMLHEAGSIFAGALAAVVKAAKPPGTQGVADGREGTTAANGDNAAACVLEHFKGEQAPFPPAPPRQGGRERSALEPGTRAYLDAAGVAHSADDRGG